MKRKLFVLILVLVVVFGMCACQRDTNVKKRAQEGEEKLASVENCSLVLRLTAGNQLELYLDADGIVLKTTNDDQDLNLEGLSYAAAVDAVLSERNVNRADVHIEVLASASGPLPPEQLQQLQQVITDDEAGKISAVDQSAVVAADCGADSVMVDELDNGDLFYDYYSGSTVVRQACYRVDGSYDEWQYEGIWPNIRTVATIHVTPDGIRSEHYCDYDENGQLIYHMQKHSDGMFEEHTYYSDGSDKTSKTGGPDGTVEEQYFDENGNYTYVYNRWADGSTRETYYYANGNPKTEEAHCPESENYIYMYRTYRENGTCEEELLRFLDGSTRQYQYDERGSCKNEIFQLSDGSTEQRKYNADGCEIFRRYDYPNGDWMVLTYYPSGRTKTEEGSVGGESYLFHYDENGIAIED